MGKSLRRYVVLLSAVLLSGFILDARGQIPLSDNSPVILDFNGIGDGQAGGAEWLNTGAWSISGLSTGDISFGSSTSFFKRINDEIGGGGGVSNGGIYLFEVEPGNRVLGIQPADNEMTPGFITLRLANTAGKTVRGMQISFDILVLNDEQRSNSLHLEFSRDNVTYSPIPQIKFETPARPDAEPSWKTVNRSTSITDIELAAGDYFYLRWVVDASAGTGRGYDEIAIDNITIQATGRSPAAEILPGDIVVTEIMANSSVEPESEGEYIELYNRTNQPINLGGLILEDGEGESHQINPVNGNTVVPPYGFLVLGKNGNRLTNGSYDPDYVYGRDLSLNNSGETLFLRSSSTLVARAEYRSSVRGAAVELVTVESGHDGKTVPEDYRMIGGGDIFGTGQRGSPGTGGNEMTLSYGLKTAVNSGWRLLSIPSGNLNLDQLTDDTPIQGLNDRFHKNLFTYYNGNSFDIPVSGMNKMPAGKGFLIYVIDNTRVKEGDSDLPIILDVSGNEPENDISVDLHTDGDRWNLLGNPYSTSINLLTLTSKGGRLASRIAQVWDDSVSSFVLSTTRGHRVLPWEGFFIQNEDASSAIIPRSSRISDDNYFTVNRNFDERLLSFELRGTDPQTNVQTLDRAAVIYFNGEAEHGWDEWDASKLRPLPGNIGGDYHSAYLYFEGNHNGRSVAKAQDSRPYQLEERTVFNLGMKTVDMAGEFTLTWDKENIPDDWRITLIDETTGSEINLDEVANYGFRTSNRSLTSESGNVELPFGVSTDPGNEIRKFRLVIQKESIREPEPSKKPEGTKLNPNYPNPFNPSTTVSFQLDEQSQVRLSVYTVIGQKVATLVDEVLDTGIHEVRWNASDMPSGIYILHLEVGGEIFTRQMTLIK